MLTLSIPAAPRLRLTALKLSRINPSVIRPVREWALMILDMRVSSHDTAAVEIWTGVAGRFLADTPGCPKEDRAGHLVASTVRLTFPCPRHISPAHLETVLRFASPKKNNKQGRLLPLCCHPMSP